MYQYRRNPPWQKHRPIITGVFWWNHKTVRALFPDAIARPSICKSFDDAVKTAITQNGCIVSWASRLTDDQIEACKAQNIPLVRMEDGFIRSIGLGAGWVPAASLILDTQGIYYDAQQPSDLEWLLEHQDVDQAETSRAKALHEKLIQTRLSKYNLGNQEKPLNLPQEQINVLVPGQVADDASILTGLSHSIDLKASANINLSLLEKARENNPDAFIIFKPHPDVTSGLRKGYLSPEQILQYADSLVEDTDIIDLLDQCQKVETFSSLTGFEALIRGKTVMVHGLPFYAGWGLTEDTTKTTRRTRKRSLDELIYLTLIAYNRYVNPITYQACEAEDAITALDKLRESSWLKWKNRIFLQLARTFESLPFSK